MPIARLLRFLTLLAVLLAPLGMLNAHAAMALPAPAPAGSHHDMAASGGHCAETAAAGQDRPADDGTPSTSIDCAIACSCMPPAAGQLAERPPLAAKLDRPRPALLLPGINPEAEPRPPQFS